MDTNKTILIIEDDSAQARAMSDCLEREGYVITIATDGEDGLQKVLLGEYSLVILDLRLPKMSGQEILQKVNEAGKKVSCIVLTNDSRLQSVSEAIGTGVTEYHVKLDTSLEKLVSLVNEKFN